MSQTKLWFPDFEKKKKGDERKVQSAALATLDHIIPRSKDGTNSYKNLRIICHACNSSKDT